MTKENPQLLHGLYEAVVLDEARFVKNVKTSLKRIVKWLEAEKNVGAMATNMPNSADDSEGYLSIVEPLRTEQERS